MKAILFSIFLFLLTLSARSQLTDTLSVHVQDSLKATQHTADSILLLHYLNLSNYLSPFYTTSGKAIVYDVQQMNTGRNSASVFFVLTALLVLLTYVKTAYSKEVEEMLQSLVNRNIAMQMFRTQTNELTFSSFLLHLNFVVVMSMYVRFVLVHYYNVSSLENFPSILFLVFLFTFFYVTKIVVVKLLGATFEVSETSNEYVYHFTVVCKTLGLALLPALFVFYVAPSFAFNFVFVFSNIIIALFATVFIWRGLSTGYKLMYRSVYHFFIYVCVVEISPIFLLFKLLTKTVV